MSLISLNIPERCFWCDDNIPARNWLASNTVYNDDAGFYFTITTLNEGETEIILYVYNVLKQYYKTWHQFKVVCINMLQRTEAVAVNELESKSYCHFAQSVDYHICRRNQNATKKLCFKNVSLHSSRYKTLWPQRRKKIKWCDFSLI